MSDQADSEKRQGERVNFETKIVLKSEDKEIHVVGNSRDLSLKGVFVKTEEGFSKGAACDIRVTLTGTIDDFDLKMKGTIVRKEGSGVAIHFNSVDLESYTHLKKLVQYNAEFPDKVL